jgi:wobble nucleotide-excising tRNase
MSQTTIHDLLDIIDKLKTKLEEQDRRIDKLEHDKWVMEEALIKGGHDTFLERISSLSKITEDRVSDIEGDLSDQSIEVDDLKERVDKLEKHLVDHGWMEPSEEESMQAE